jgi:hypothetical protein
MEFPISNSTTCNLIDNAAVWLSLKDSLWITTIQSHPLFLVTLPQTAEIKLHKSFKKCNVFYIKFCFLFLILMFLLCLCDL